MIGMLKYRYLHAIELFGYIYAVSVLLLWSLGMLGERFELFPLVTLVASFVPPIYHFLIFPLLAKSHDVRTAYIGEVTVLAMPILAVSLCTGGYESFNNIVVALLIFLSTMVGLTVPLLLLWIQMLVLIAALSGQMPRFADHLGLGVLYFGLYVVALIAGWRLFKHYYVQENANAERLRKTLKAEKLQSEGIINAIDDGVCIINQAGTVKHVNARFLEMVSSREDELLDRHYTYPMAINKRVRVVSSSINSPHLTVHIAKVFETGQPVVIEQERIEYIDGSRSYDLAISLLPLKNEEDVVSALMIIARDISSLIKVQHLKDEFISTASHELRTPATAVSGYLDLLLSTKAAGLNEEQLHFLQETKLSTTQLVSLINDMIDMSSLETGKYENHPSPVRLDRVTQKIVDTVASRYTSKYVTKTIDVAIPTIMVDEQRLQLVLNHLIDNAFKFTPDKGMVSVRGVTDGDSVVVEVADTGMSIPEEERERIFEKFTKLDTTGATSGSGLGLSIARRVVDDWGGDIKISSQESGGTVFSFSIPGALPDQPAASLPVDNTSLQQATV
jgi:signal transduction histidine kinase